MANGLAKNTTITLIAKTLSFTISIGVSVILARSLEAEGKGIYALAILIPSLIYTFSNFGIGSSIVYFLGKKKYPPRLVVGNTLLFSLVFFGIMIILFTAFYFLFKETLFANIPPYALYLGVPLAALILLNDNLTKVLLGTHRYIAYNTILSLTIVVQLALLLGVLLLGSITIFTAYISYIFTILIITIIVITYLRRKIGLFHFNLTKQYIKDFFTFGLKVYFGNIMAFLHLRIDMLMLNSYINPTAVGHYSVSVGLTERIWMLPDSAATILFPRITSESDESTKKNITAILCRNVLLITFFSSILLFFISEPLIVFLFSEQFVPAVLPLQILLIGTFINSGSKILGNDMAARGKPLINTYTNTITLIINIALNLVLIRKFGLAGVAYASTISYSLLFIMRLLAYTNISKNKISDVLFVKKQDFLLYRDFFKAGIVKIQQLFSKKTSI